MDNIIRFSVSLPKQLLEELDKKIDTQGYASRSEFTRDLIREKIVQDSWKNTEEELLGVLTIIYTHQSDLVGKIMSIRHNADADIACTTDVGIDNNHSLQTLLLRGKAKNIEKFAEKIGGLKGVKFSKLTKAAVPK